MGYYPSSILFIVGLCSPLSSFAQQKEIPEQPASPLLAMPPAVKRLIFELTAEGYERRATLIEKGLVESELSFLRLMYESYKVVDRSGLPSSYISYMDEMLAWLDKELPQLMKDKPSKQHASLILGSYHDKLAELSQKYKIAHATLTSQNNEFRKLLDESGFSREITIHMNANRDLFHRDPKKALVDFYRFMGLRLRELMKSTNQSL